MLSYKKSVLAAGLTLLAGMAAAADFYVVTPVVGKVSSSSPGSAISVALNAYALPSGMVGVAYDGFDLNTLLTVTGDGSYAGTGASWQVTAGGLPAGISLSSTGHLSGMPTAAGTGSFTLKASYKAANGQQSYQIVVADMQVTLESASLPEGMVGNPYSYDFKPRVAVPGDASYSADQVTFNVVSGSLPAGLSLSSVGVLSGTPTVSNAAGDSFQVLATYKTKSGQQGYTIVVGNAVLHVTSLTVGDNHTCAIATTGKLKCWGYNTYGQLGIGNSVSQPLPVDVVDVGKSFSNVVAGANYTCAIASDHTAWCWGLNSNGQLGLGDTVTYTVPTQVTALGATVAQLGLGVMHSCAVTTAGSLQCWGYNGQGQLGNNTTTARLTPATPTGMSSGVTRVTAGNQHTCAIQAGSAWCWGGDNHGQLGDNSGFANQLIPIRVAGMTAGVTDISAGEYHTCAVVNGAAKCWGSDQSGQLGNDTTIYDLGTPAAVLGQTSGVARISAGGNHSCLVTAAGAMWCWGMDSSGQLGNDTAYTNKAIPVAVSGLTTGVVDLSLGTSYTCASLATGDLKCWGNDTYGQLGNDTALLKQPVPVDVHP